jgi:hypothetical protein
MGASVMRRPRAARDARRAFTFAGLLLVGAFCCARPPLAATGTLEGHWRLVEVRYGSGEANLVGDDPPVHLEIAATPSGLTCELDGGASLAAPLPWPAFVGDSGPLPLSLKERAADLMSGTLTASYSVHPVEGEPLVLDIEERYRISDDGASLAGEMTVRFRDDGGDRGSYTLHRRFEREP